MDEEHKMFPEEAPENCVLKFGFRIFSHYDTISIHKTGKIHLDTTSSIWILLAVTHLLPWSSL